MATYADKQGGSIRPGVKRLTEDTGLSKASVDRALAELREAGLVACVWKAPVRSPRADLYRLAFPHVTHGEAHGDRAPEDVAPQGEAPTDDPQSSEDVVTQPEAPTDHPSPYPCFQHGVVGCDCKSPEEEVQMCDLHSSFPKDECDYCKQPTVESKLPAWKQQQLYERDIAKDGLNKYGEPLGIDY